MSVSNHHCWRIFIAFCKIASITRSMNGGIRPNLANTNEHHHVNETRERVHVPTDHDRLEQERYNERIERERITGRITIFEAEWAKHVHVRECHDMQGYDNATEI